MKAAMLLSAAVIVPLNDAACDGITPTTDAVRPTWTRAASFSLVCLRSAANPGRRLAPLAAPSE